MSVHILKFILVLFLSMVSMEVSAEDCNQESCKETPLNNYSNSKNISYEEFLALKSSGQSFLLWDVRGEENFKTNHIPGAESFPLKQINEKSVAKRASKDAKIIVYCSSSTCSMSRSAAVILKGLGYDVLHYKGGMSEWTAKGNLTEKVL